MRRKVVDSAYGDQKDEQEEEDEEKGGGQEGCS